MLQKLAHLRPSLTNISGVARMDLLLGRPSKNLKKNHPSIASKIGATLKGKNLLPEGANSFLSK